VFRYPAGRSRDLAGNFFPATLMGFCALRSFAPARDSRDVSVPRNPPAVFAKAPWPIIWSADRSPVNTTHPHSTATSRGRFAAAPRFFFADNPAAALRSSDADTALGFASLRSLDTGTSRRARASARKLCPFRQPRRSLPIVRRSWSSRRCRIACPATSSSIFRGAMDVGASRAGPSAFKAGA
jgi:hypothetical protein